MVPLVKQCMATDCVCNPIVMTLQDHICPGLLQFLFQNLRINMPTVVPFTLGDDTLDVHLPLLDTPAWQTIHAFWLSRDFEGMTLDEEIHVILRTTCVYCNRRMHPGEIWVHLLETDYGTVNASSGRFIN